MEAIKWLLLISLVVLCPALGLFLGSMSLLFDAIKN